MNKTTFVIVSVSDRLQALNNLLALLRADARWNGIDINILFQDPDNVRAQVHVLTASDQRLGRTTRMFVKAQKVGCHAARVLLLREIAKDGYETFINLDDDIEPGTYTNYAGAIVKAQEPQVGFVMTNWARTEALLQKKVPGLEEALSTGDRFSKQIMLYNGGGMVYTEKIAALMRELAPVKTAFDCAWPITAYVNGYTNYYDYGSLTIHRVCRTGGMSTFMEETPLHVTCAEWLRFRPLKVQDGSCNDVAVPLDGDVLPQAKAEHKRMRIERFGA